MYDRSHWCGTMTAAKSASQAQVSTAPQSAHLYLRIVSHGLNRARLPCSQPAVRSVIAQGADEGRGLFAATS